jgi:biopolymer transport protein ExbB
MKALPVLHFDNPVVWAIVGLALLCYICQFNLLLSERDSEWRRRTGVWLRALPVLLSALPLLGLLGTIVGLLTTFRAMGRSDALAQTFLTSGIADALITTRLGLITLIPGLLLYALLRRCHRNFVL